MSEPAPRRSFHPAVRSVERLTPSLVRIVFGDDLDGFAAGAFTDHYVKLHFPPPGAAYGPPFDVADIKGRLPR